MMASYVLWALSEPDAWMRGWHLASAVPLAAALFRFDRLTGLADGRPVEDLIARDPMMICCELTWLTDVHGGAVMPIAAGPRGLLQSDLGRRLSLC